MKNMAFVLALLALAVLPQVPAHAQSERAPPATESPMPEPGGTGEPASPRNLPDTMTPPAGEDELMPGALSPRAQFEAAMVTVDSGFTRLMPAVPLAAAELKRLAFARLAREPRAAAEQQRLLQMRVRELAVAQSRLQSIERVLDRWRGTASAVAGGSAAMIGGVRRRSATAAALHHQIDCGRYFAQATARAMRNGSTAARPPIPPGC